MVDRFSMWIGLVAPTVVHNSNFIDPRVGVFCAVYVLFAREIVLHTR